MRRLFISILACLACMMMQAQDGSKAALPQPEQTITPSEFMEKFSRGGWMLKNVVNVQEDGTETEVNFYGITAYGKIMFKVANSVYLKEYFNLDSASRHFRYHFPMYWFGESGNTLTIYNCATDSFNGGNVVMSIDNDELVTVGKVMYDLWYPGSVYGIYTFEHVSDDVVAEWDARYIYPLEISDEDIGDFLSTAVPTVTADQPAASDYYTLDGRHNATPRQGLNIVRTPEGQVKKYVVK